MGRFNNSEINRGYLQFINYLIVTNNMEISL
jgi:hypothetical protein